MFSAGLAHAACPPVGSGITANGATASESNCTINTTLGGRSGIQASNAANVNLSDSTITTSGASSHGVRVQGTGNTLVTVNGTSVSVTGGSSIGVFVSGGVGGTPTAIFNNSSIRATAANTRGAAVDNGGQLFLNNTSVTTDGNSAHAVLQATPGGGSIFINGGSVTANGQGAIAVYGSVNIGGIVVDGATIVANGVSGMGLRASSGSVVSALNGTHVTTTNTNGYALHSQTGSLVSVANGTVETFGKVGIGAYLFNGSRIDIIGTSITTHAEDGYGLYTQSPAGITNTFNATGSMITTQAAYAMVGFGGINNVNLSGTTVSSGINQLLFVGALPTVSAPNDPDAPTAVGANSATFNLTAVLSNLRGDTAVTGNSAANLSLTASTLTGAIATDVGSTTNAILQNGSTWNVTDNSNVTSMINNASLIQFTPPSGDVTDIASYRTLTTTNYVGAGGTIGLNTRLAADGSPSDKLVINGGTASGNSILRIANTGGGGALTTGNGILVVDAINSGTTAPGVFALGGTVAAGPFQYTLHRSSVDASNEQAWYLRSTLDCSVPGAPSPPCPAPGPGPTPSGPPVPDFRPETSVYAAVPAMALLYGRNLLDTLHERVGEEGDIHGRSDLHQQGPYTGGWARFLGMTGRRDGDSNGIFGAGPQYSYDFLGLQAGQDLARREHADGSRDHVGIYFAVGGAQGRVTHFDGRTGDNDFQGYTFGGYWTHFGAAGWYVDTILQGTRYNITSNAHTGLPALTPRGDGVAGSLEAGYPFRLPLGFFIEPQVQLIYQAIKVNDASDTAALVRFADVDSLAGRIGARFGRTWALDDGPLARTITAWIRPNIWHEFRGNPLTEFSSDTGFIPFRADLGGTWGELNAGISGQLNAATTLFANAAYQSRFEGKSYSYTGKLGVRVNW